MFKRSNPNVERLKAVGLFKGLGDREIRATGEHAEFTTYEPGATFIEEGELSSSVYLIVEGSAIVTRDSEVLATIGAGTVLGEAALLDYWKPPSGETAKYDAARRTATVTATKDAPLEVLSFEPRAFEQLRGDAPAVAQRLLSGLNKRFQDD